MPGLCGRLQSEQAQRKEGTLDSYPSCHCMEPQEGTGLVVRRGSSGCLGGNSGWELRGKREWQAGPPASCFPPACQPQLLPGGFQTVLSSCFKFPGRGLRGGGVLQAVWGAGCDLPGALWDAVLQDGGSCNCFQLGCQPEGRSGGLWGSEEARGVQGPEGVPSCLASPWAPWVAALAGMGNPGRPPRT